MRSYAIPVRYFLVLVIALLLIIGADIATAGTNAVVANLGNTILILFFIFFIYSVGVALIIHRIQEEASRLTAIRIFITILFGIAAFLAMAVWIDDPAQIVLTLGIIWGAVFIALRDLIQNMVGSLMLLATGMYRIGDRIRVKGVYGLVMDIGVFRTMLMELDRDAGDRPTGEIVMVPNGILFREVMVNTTRHISVVSDEIRITLPFKTDLEKARIALLESVTRHTGTIEKRAVAEIEQLGQKKYLPRFETGPTINLALSDYGIVMILKYITTTEDRAAIKTRIVEDFSRQIPGIMEIRQ